MILDDIKKKLQEVDSKVYYAAVDLSVKDTVWDYIVFERSALRVNANKTGYTEEYTLRIIREEFIPEGLEIEVIEKMLEIPGMRLKSDGGTYEYVPKPNTNNVVEMFSVGFVRSKKKV